MTSPPALALLNPNKPFELFIDERSGVARGVLTQRLGPWRRPIAYLSKQLDPVASGWPPCVRQIAATALLVRDTNKLTMGQNLNVFTPHTVETLLRIPPECWLSNAQIVQYQALLLDQPRITLEITSTLNPATLLPTTVQSSEEKDFQPHECLSALQTYTTLRSDLTDIPLQNPQLTLFTDGSSLIDAGTRKAGAAVTTISEIVWQQSLPVGTSAQRAELIALTKVLQLAKDKTANIYTDGRYAFATTHVRGQIYQERGLLTAEGKTIKNKQEILNLLAAMWEPKRLAIIHCPGHQRDETPIAKGNRLADQAARQAAMGTPTKVLTQKPKLTNLLPDPSLPRFPKYSPKDLDWITKKAGGINGGRREELDPR